MNIEKNQSDIIRQQIIDVQVNWSRPNEERAVVAHIPNQSLNSHFGKVTITGKVQIQQLSRSQQKPDRQREIQTLKMQLESSAKKNKVFSFSLPINRLTKKNDTKIHLLLELTQKKGLLTIADDYAECKMNIKGKSQISIQESVQRQKKRADRRRKNSGDQPLEHHNDPEMKGEDEDDG